MARTNQTPAPAPKMVTVRVTTSFNDVQRDDVATLELTPRVQGWINAGLVVVEDGTSTSGPGGAQPDDHKRVPAGTDGSQSAGGEQGQGFGTSGYGAPAKLDKG